MSATAAAPSATEESTETCARLMVGSPPSPIFVKGTWFPRHFSLEVSDGLRCWTCDATEQAVAERAAGWDESVPEYLQSAQFHLSHQHPNSMYAFHADGDNRKLSWTMEKKGTKLEGKWRCEKARPDQEVTTNILNFLMDSNIKLSDEVLRKKQSFERMKTEAEKCLRQSEQFKNEKQQFETDIFRKFVAVLNSKKSKLRELRDKLAKFEPTASRADDEEETDADESDEEEANDKSNNGDGEAANMAGDGQIAHEIPSPTAVTENKPQTQVVVTENKHQTQAAVQENKPWTQAAKVSEEHGSGMAPDQDGSSVKSVIDSAAALLGDSDYTSAPKRRRRV